MSAQFPPSSPAVHTMDHGVYGNHHNGISPDTTLNIIAKKSLVEQNESFLEDTHNDNLKGNSIDNSFILPTPNPSSELHDSSPVKNQSTDGNYKNINNHHSDDNVNDNDNASDDLDINNSSPSRGIVENTSSTPVKTKKLASSSPKQQYTMASRKRYALFEIPISYKDTDAQVSVKCGRNSQANDVSLPHDKLISRSHLNITYYPWTENLKIQCLGRNGVIVVYPKKLSSYHLLEKQEQLTNDNDNTTNTIKEKETVYELVSTDEPNITHSSDNESSSVPSSNGEHDSAKQLVKRKGLTSFVIKQNETCYMPYFPGLILDFQKFESVIALKKLAKNKKSTNFNSKETNNKKRKADEQINKKSNVAALVKKENTEDHDFLDFNELEASLVAKNIDVPEITRVLINHLAYAPIQQVPLSSLFHVNSAISKLSKRELRYLLIKKSGKCVGVVYRTGKDAAGKPLEDEYYYEIMNDEDEDRKAIVTSLKGGRANLRNCRKTHKQYFWKKPKK